MNWFKVVSAATAVLFSYLFVMCLFQSTGFVDDMGLSSSVATGILARRASMFMLGIAILAAASQSLPHSAARQVICLAIAVPLAGLACLGSYELLRGTVNSSMVIAIGIETTLAVAYGVIVFVNWRRRIHP